MHESRFSEEELSRHNEISNLLSHVRERLDRKVLLREFRELAKSGRSTAGKRCEEVFTREHICPCLREYFLGPVRYLIPLTDQEIERELLTEGFKNCPGFGGTPARPRKHLFDKKLFIEPGPPEEWTMSPEKFVRDFRPSPDFAIGNLLGIKAVGETAFFYKGSVEQGIKKIYDYVRQATFYLGAFTGKYHSALLALVDGSLQKGLIRGYAALHPEIKARLGLQSKIYIVPIELV